MIWNDEARKWIELARDGHDPSPADTRRVRRAVIGHCIAAGSIAATAGAAASTAASTATATTAITLKAVLVNASVALVVAGSVATATRVWFDATSPSAAVTTSTAAGVPPMTTAARSSRGPRAAAQAPSEGDSQLPAAPAAEPSSEAARPWPTSVVVAGGRSASPPVAGPTGEVRGVPAAPTRTLEREIAGLRSAQQALNRGESDSAERALDKLERTNPEGALLEERLATRAILACTSGNDPGANNTVALKEFVERYPASVHVSRVRAACLGEKQAVGRFPETGPAGQEH